MQAKFFRIFAIMSLVNFFIYKLVLSIVLLILIVHVSGQQFPLQPNVSSSGSLAGNF